MRISASCFVFTALALAWLATGTTALQAQAGNPAGLIKYKQVKGWVINQYARSMGGASPSCSAVRFQDRSNAIRIERFAGGYFYGLNGLSRKAQGARYKLAFWFDDDRSTRLQGQAAFVRDAAYPDDDWLSHFLAVKDRAQLISMIANRNRITFAFNMPGNRTGRDEVTSAFDLHGSAAAILALDECYQLASIGRFGPAGTHRAPPSRMASPNRAAPRAVSDCPDDGPRLAASRLCRGRAVNYLNIVGGEQPQLPPGCSWVVNETPMPGGDFLLYLAAGCKGRVSQLAFAGGARFSFLSVASSALSDGQPGGKIITIGSAEPNDPSRNVLLYAQGAMDNKAAAARCRVRKSGGGDPSDAVVVDVSPAEAARAARAAQGEPRAACGPFGLDQENTQYWRVFGGFSWFFNLGQDAYQDIDPRSLTLLKASDMGR